MTREEAIEYAESKKMRLEALVYNDDCKYGNYAMYSGELSFVNAALSALRSPAREMVERMRGEWMFPIFTDQQDANNPRCQCSECGSIETPLARHRFCPACGSPMTDEAVQMVMERMEALKDAER